jgi:serine/threonine protein kinase
LFDFGLAKELRDEDRCADDTHLYRMTALTGAIRYMAPEVGLQKPYNLKADVYSWSMLMWYILALEPPMGLYTPRMIVDRVFRKGVRPATQEKWSDGLKKLLKEAWSASIDERPSFPEIMLILRDEVEALDRHVALFMGDSSREYSVQPADEST